MTVSARPSAPHTQPSPLARRVRRPGWRDPRLAGGVALVASCALLGARLLDGADETVAVWTVRADKVAGQVLPVEDLEAVEIRFADAGAAERYLSAEAPPPEGSVVVRDVGAGELLPREAVADDGPGLVELPVPVPSAALPASLAVGDSVDVWVTASAANAGSGSGVRPHQAVPVLKDVVVVALPTQGDAFDTGADRQVIVALDEADHAGLPEALARIAAGNVVLTRRAGR